MRGLPLLEKEGEVGAEGRHGTRNASGLGCGGQQPSHVSSERVTCHSRREGEWWV